MLLRAARQTLAGKGNPTPALDARLLLQRAAGVSHEEMIADPAAALRIAAELCDLDVPDAPAPAMGHDRGCAAPYRQLMDAAMES